MPFANAEAYRAARKRKCAKPILYGPEFRADWTRSPLRWIEHATPALRLAATMESPPDNWHNACGWCCDEFGDQVAYGVALQLPARDGSPRYVPAVQDPNNANCYIVAFGDVTDTLADALRWGDSMAESYAEADREYQELSAAAFEVQDLRDAISAARAEHSATARELREALRDIPAGRYPALCGMLRKALRDTRRRVRRDARAIRELFERHGERALAEHLGG